MSIAAVILAGGLSRRMGGQVKGMLPLHGTPLILHVAARLALQVSAVAVNARAAEPWQGLGFPLAMERRDGAEGPLAGVEAALAWADTDWVFTAPCDTPFLPLDLVEGLRAEAGETPPVPVVVEHGGRFHATLCLWPRAVLPEITAALERGERRLAGWIQGRAHRVWRLPDRGEDPFFNVNTPEALQEAERRWVQSIEGRGA